MFSKILIAPVIVLFLLAAITFLSITTAQEQSAQVRHLNQIIFQSYRLTVGIEDALAVRRHIIWDM